MLLSQIFEQCSKQFSLINSKIIKNLDIHLIQLITSGNQVSIPNSLCILTKYEKNFTLESQCHYLVPIDYLSNYSQQNVTLYDRKVFIELFLFLQNLIVDRSLFFEKIMDIENILNRCQDLDEIAFELSCYFNNPIVFVDDFFNNIACYPKDPTHCKPYDAFLQIPFPALNLAISEDNIRELIYPEIFRTYLTSFKPFMVPSINGGIYADGKIIGSMALFAHNQPITQIDVKLIDYLLLLIAGKSFIRQIKEKNSLTTFYHTLLNHSFNIGSVLDDMAKFKLDTTAGYITLIIQSTQANGLSENQLMSLKRILNADLYAFIEMKLIFSIPCQQWNAEMKKQLASAANTNQWMIAIDDYPRPLLKTDFAYFLGSQLLERTAEQSGLLLTSQHYYELVFANPDLFSKENRENLFYYDQLLPLIDQNSERMSDFYQTLKLYIFSHSNLNDTAEQLCIHRNTLSYRLEKISDLLQIDFNDSNAKNNLLLTLKLLEPSEK